MKEPVALHEGCMKESVVLHEGCMKEPVVMQEGCMKMQGCNNPAPRECTEVSVSVVVLCYIMLFLFRRLLWYKVRKV